MACRWRRCGTRWRRGVERAAGLWPGELTVLTGGREDFADRDDRLDPATAMTAPVVADGRIVGILTVSGRTSGGMQLFGAEDAKMLGTLSVQLGVAVEKGRLHGLLSSAHAEREELVQRTLVDSLTGLHNRDAFTAALEDALAMTNRSMLAVSFIDLDDFKQVNDIHGHETGDTMLRAVAERMRGCLRPQDIAARFGGDEFGVLLHDVRDADAATMVCRRIVDAVSEPLVVSGGVARVGASIGVRVAETGATTAAALLRDADSAMYTAKRTGKGTVIVWSTDSPELRVAGEAT